MPYFSENKPDIFNKSCFVIGVIGIPADLLSFKQKCNIGALSVEMRTFTKYDQSLKKNHDNRKKCKHAI